MLPQKVARMRYKHINNRINMSNIWDPQRQ